MTQWGGASLNKEVKEGLTEELAFKARPEGQDYSYMKSQKNILRRKSKNHKRASYFLERVKYVKWSLESKAESVEHERGGPWLDHAKSYKLR